ncbi:MAG: trypsin-like serine protease [Sandaracinaceae bacterium]
MQTLRSALLLLCALMLTAACGGEADPDGGIVLDIDGAAPGTDGGTTSGGMCAERRRPLVYFGTPEPTELPLTQGQILAIGNWGGCSGAFISDEWVLTAQHCGIRPGRQFCVGEDRFNPNVCFQAAEVQSHPQRDMALVRMDAPASSRIPALEPIAIMTEQIDSTWFGTLLEAAGYGTQEDGSSGEREFSAEPLVDFEGPFAVIDGEGRRGVCFGDSGGPLMILASDSTVRVLGDLSYGDPSCVGRDRYTRTDLVVDWIESFTGPTAVTGGSCGTIDEEGSCNGNLAVWCDGDTLASERCEDGARCGWDADNDAYRCITGADPCDGVTAEGACQDNVATWCDRGTVQRRDCGACGGEGMTCQNVAELGGVYCDVDPCDGLDYLGECRGEVAVWCQEGEVQTRNCAERGLRCGFINDTVGFFCGR